MELYLCYSDTDLKVIDTEEAIITKLFGGEENNMNELDLLGMLEEAYDRGELDPEYLPYGVYDIEFISPTEVYLIHEDHHSPMEKTRAELKTL